MLEEGSFRNRTSDFVLMFVFGALCMIVSLIYCSYIFVKTKKIYGFIFVNNGNHLVQIIY